MDVMNPRLDEYLAVQEAGGDDSVTAAGPDAK